MYLTRLLLLPGDPVVARTLAQPTTLHKAVFAGFDRAARGEQRVLYRQEPEHHPRGVQVLVQSPLEPAWEDAWERWFGASPAPQTREFDPASWGLRPGDSLRFRLVGNPTRRLSTPGRERGPDLKPHEKPRLPLCGVEQQLAWLERKLAAAGASLGAAQVTAERDLSDGSGGRTFRLVCFDGRLTTVNPSALLTAVVHGIGSAKGFGCGLLSLAR